MSLRPGFDPALEHFCGGAIDRIGPNTVLAERRLGEFDHVIVSMSDRAVDQLVDAKSRRGDLGLGLARRKSARRPDAVV